MTVSRILKDKGTAVISVGLEDTVQTVIDTLGRNRVGAVVVLRGKDELVGIISERDVIRALTGDAAAALARTAEEIMTGAVETCGTEDPETEIMQRMSAKGIRHLPVVSGGRIAGLVSMRDVIKLRIEKIDQLMRSIEREAEQMKGLLSPVK